MSDTYELTDVRVKYISFVGRAANRRGFLSAKRIGEGRIIGAEGGIVCGIVYEPLTLDSQGCFMTADEIRGAAYRFAKNGMGIDVGHSFRRAEGVYLLESYVAPCDMHVCGQHVREGTWLITAEVTDEKLLRAIERGDAAGFSMGGTGRRTKSALPERAAEGQSESGAAAGSPPDIEALIQAALDKRLDGLDARITESIDKSMEPYTGGVAANHGGDKSAPQHYLKGIL